MKLLLTAATIALAGMMGIACNDDDSNSGTDTLTLEQYFAELERISDEAEAAIDEIDSPELEEDASFEEARDAFALFFETAANATEDAVDDMRGLDPPDEVQDEHDRYVNALDQLPEISNSLQEQIAGAETQEEFDEIVGMSDPFEEIVAEVAGACEDLQQIADGNNITADLDCNA